MCVYTLLLINFSMYLCNYTRSCIDKFRYKRLFFFSFFFFAPHASSFFFYLHGHVHTHARARSVSTARIYFRFVEQIYAHSTYRPLSSSSKNILNLYEARSRCSFFFFHRSLSISIFPRGIKKNATSITIFSFSASRYREVSR